MSGDVRTRLSEALDEAEELAKAAIESVEHSTGNWGRPRDHASGPYMVEDHFGCGAIVYHEGRPTADQALHIARWDPSTVLRLVAYFRKLLADHEHPLGAQIGAEPCLEIKAAAEFWLGTPEVDR